MYGAVSLWYHTSMNEKQNSPSPASDADLMGITSKDVKNVLNLIKGAPINVEDAEIVVALKIKLATLHNRLLAAEDSAAEKQ